MQAAEKLIARPYLRGEDVWHSIGYWLSADQTGRGYATQACQSALDYYRGVLAGSDVFAGVTRGNTKSAAVLVRLGFGKVAEFETYDRYHLMLQGPASVHAKTPGQPGLRE